jgi:hypothetical protein
VLKAESARLKAKIRFKVHGIRCKVKIIFAHEGGMINISRD